MIKGLFKFFYKSMRVRVGAFPGQPLTLTGFHITMQQLGVLITPDPW